MGRALDVLRYGLNITKANGAVTHPSPMDIPMSKATRSRYISHPAFLLARHMLLFEGNVVRGTSIQLRSKLRGPHCPLPSSHPSKNEKGAPGTWIELEPIFLTECHFH